jgi:hypothetical protein
MRRRLPSTQARCARSGRAPSELHARGRGTGADAGGGVTSGCSARRRVGCRTVPSHPSRHDAHRGRRRLRAAGGSAARWAGARHTRPAKPPWRRWFDAQGVEAKRAMSGPRYELGLDAGRGRGVRTGRGSRADAAGAAGTRGRHARGRLHPAAAESGGWLLPCAPAEDERAALTAFREWLLAEAGGG